MATHLPGFSWPLSSLPAFKPVTANRIAYDPPGRSINLPSYHDMTEDDLTGVVDVLHRMARNTV